MVNNDMERLINGYIKYLQEIKNLSPKSIKVYIPRVKDMIKFCKFSTLNDIQNSTIIQLKYWLDSKKDYSNQYINQCIATAKSFYGFLVAYRLIDFNPAKELKQLRIESKGKIGNTGQVDKIRKYLQDEYDRKPNYMNMRNRLIVEVMLNCALRNSELRQLNIDSINPNTGEFTVIQKGGSNKNCVLSSKTLQLYNEYMIERNRIPSKDNSLFLSSYKSRISIGGLEKLIHKITEVTGQQLNPHDLRHISATKYVEAGFSCDEVAKLLGHSSSNTTFRFYYHQDNDNKKKMVENTWD